MRIEKIEHEVEHQVHDAYKAVEHAVDAVVHAHHHTADDPPSGSLAAGIAGAGGGAAAGSLSRPQSSKPRKLPQPSSFHGQAGGGSPAPAAGMPHTASKRVNLPHTVSKGIKSRIVEISSGVAGAETRVIAELSDAIDR
jgi:hypothetical protein